MIFFHFNVKFEWFLAQRPKYTASEWVGLLLPLRREGGGGGPGFKTKFCSILIGDTAILILFLK